MWQSISYGEFDAFLRFKPSDFFATIENYTGKTCEAVRAGKNIKKNVWRKI
jgi:hypothetical protein